MSKRVLNPSKLALGTAQFGLPYGIANNSGKINPLIVEGLLRQATRAGLDTLDTAIAYGSSEECLGKAGVNGWHVISKLPPLPEDCVDISGWVQGQVEESLLRLKLPHLTGLLLHKPSQLLGKNGGVLWQSLNDLKQAGLVDKIGFSIYGPTELDSLWDTFTPDLVQTPYNVLDRRLVSSGWLQQLNEAGVEVHVRSVFLQGLLLMGKTDRPKQFSSWSNLWAEWDRWLSQHGVTALQSCLAFAMHEPGISKVIVGVDGMKHLEEILSSVAIDSDSAFPDLAIDDPELIDPSRWNLL